MNGMEMDPVSLVELLNEIGARNAVGRVDLVENRFVGIKSRGCYETPGGTLLITAHRELEALCLERDVAHFKQHIGLKYAEIVYFGLWFTPLREALDAFVDKTQDARDRPVYLSLYKGNVSIVSRKSEFSLYRTDLSSFTMGDSYDQKDAEGFIRILGLPSRSYAQVHAEKVRGRRDEDVVGPVPAAAGPRLRTLAAFVRLRPPVAQTMNSRQAGRYAQALKAAGVLSLERTDLHPARAGADRREGCGFAGSFFEDDEAEDMHHFVEKQLVALIGGDAGYKLHSGRSRNEQIATDLRLYVRAAIDQLHEQLAELSGAFVERAEQAGDAAMPAYTHLQRAEPVLVGHWLLAYVEMFLRDADRWPTAASG